MTTQSQSRMPPSALRETRLLDRLKVASVSEKSLAMYLRSIGDDPEKAGRPAGKDGTANPRWRMARRVRDDPADEATAIGELVAGVRRIGEALACRMMIGASPRGFGIDLDDVRWPMAPQCLSSTAVRWGDQGSEPILDVGDYLKAVRTAHGIAYDRMTIGREDLRAAMTSRGAGRYAMTAFAVDVTTCGLPDLAGVASRIFDMVVEPYDETIWRHDPAEGGAGLYLERILPARCVLFSRVADDCTGVHADLAEPFPMRICRGEGPPRFITVTSGSFPRRHNPAYTGCLQV